MTIQVIFSDHYNQKFATNSVKSINTIEQEGKAPNVTLTMDPKDYDEIYALNFCEIRRDDEEFFKGIVISHKYEGSDLKVRLVVLPDSLLPIEIGDCAILAKFKLENPDLFTDLEVEDFALNGQIHRSNLLIPNNPLDISDEMIAPLTAEHNRENQIDEIDLKVKGAWISRREGNIPISTKIDKRFGMGKVNTLTPKNLLDSWPQFGDKFSRKSKTTKYYVGQSRLRESETIPLPAIEITPHIPALNLSKHIFNNKLSIAWDYDQYMSETCTLKIKNDLSKPKARPALGTLDLLNLNLQTRKKNLYINLKNVQEYTSSPFDSSFFRSKNGKVILNEIVKSTVNYTILSMRNLEISFDCLESEKVKNLSCHNWISFNGVNYKIVKIERKIDNRQSRLSITGLGFSQNIESNFKMTPVLELEKPEEKTIYAEDIIEDIVVKNDATQQYEKLLAYISQLKKENKINLANYKSLVLQFLNDHQTEIQIITKPLKTRHCENIDLNLGEFHIEECSQ